MSLILNIPANDVSSDFIANTPDKIPVIPKLSRPKLFPELGKLLECLSRRDTLHYLHHLSRRVFRRGFGKYMHVVFHYFHSIYVKAVLFSYMQEDPFKIFRYLSAEYLLPIFGYPHQMVFKVIDGMFGSSYSHVVFYNSYRITLARVCLALQRATFIPPASWRVFSGVSL